MNEIQICTYQNLRNCRSLRYNGICYTGKLQSVFCPVHTAFRQFPGFESDRDTVAGWPKNLAGDYAGKIQAEFQVALDAARTMADTFSLSKSDNNGGLSLGRDQINAILLKVLKDNPNFNGTYSCWEPNALDGQDASLKPARMQQFSNRTIYSLLEPRRERQHRRSTPGGI